MPLPPAPKLAAVLALSVIATTGCASGKQDLARAEQAKFMDEVSVNPAKRRADYLKCVLDDARTQATEPGSDAIAPGDLVDVSLATCGALLKDAQEDFGVQLLSGGDDVVRAAAAATRAADTVRASARGQAIALIVDARRKRASTSTNEAGS